MTIQRGFLLLSLIFLIAACHRGTESANESLTQDFTPETTPPENIREIFYHLYLPDEMSRIFESVGANFNPELPNSPDNFSHYDDPLEIAVALGVYGVDLYYARLFDQNVLTAGYFQVIQILSEKIGIPESYYEDLYIKLEDEFVNRDSLANIATRMYQRTDQYLKERGDNAHAALIIMAGWVEALYIACNILSDNVYNMEILDRIAEQKYSLNSLIFLLSNYQEEIVITEYLLMLKRLRKAFDRFEIYFQKERFRMDTAHRTITASEYESNIDDNIAGEIISLTSEIRESLVK